jgi:4-hydroxybenzoate polyprenyltransferase
MASRKWVYFLQALRPYQWVKNGFVLLPIVFAGKLGDLEAVLRVTAAFAVFCAAASSVYIANDLVDLEADKLHPIKKLRPLAQGHLSKSGVSLLALTLAVAAVGLGFVLNFGLGVCLSAYIAGNLLYTQALKRIVILDVMCLGLFFLLRVIAGAVVISVNVSEWLLICSAILALFLGFNKRRHELLITGNQAGEHRKVLDKYSIYFIDQMVSVLTASTVIFYTLYTVDDRTVEHFGSNGLLFTVPFVYYGIFRYLYLVHKRRQGGDPSRIILKDKMLQLNIIFWLATAIGVIYFGR